MLSAPSVPHVVSSDQNTDQTGPRPTTPEIVVCIGHPQSAARLISHGMALGGALYGDVILLHALEPRSSGSLPVDPIEWDIHRRDIKTMLGQCAKRYETSD